MRYDNVHIINININAANVNEQIFSRLETGKYNFILIHECKQSM